MNKISNVIEFVKARKEAKGDEGFSLIELVVAVGILAILSVTGVVAYSQITKNSRKTATDSAAAEVFTAAVAYENDNDPATTAATAMTDWNNSANANLEAPKKAPLQIKSAAVTDGTLTVVAEHTGGGGYEATKSGKI